MDGPAGAAGAESLAPLTLSLSDTEPRPTETRPAPQPVEAAAEAAAAPRSPVEPRAAKRPKAAREWVAKSTLNGSASEQVRQCMVMSLEPGRDNPGIRHIAATTGVPRQSIKRGLDWLEKDASRRVGDYEIPALGRGRGRIALSTLSTPPQQAAPPPPPPPAPRLGPAGVGVGTGAPPGPPAGQTPAPASWPLVGLPRGWAVSNSDSVAFITYMTVTEHDMSTPVLKVTVDKVQMKVKDIYSVGIKLPDSELSQLGFTPSTALVCLEALTTQWRVCGGTCTNDERVAKFVRQVRPTSAYFRCFCGHGVS